jgi:hypothetical protein
LLRLHASRGKIQLAHNPKDAGLPADAFARTTDRFDLIEMSLADTWAATGAGAYWLSANGFCTLHRVAYVSGYDDTHHTMTPTGVVTAKW